MSSSRGSSGETSWSKCSRQTLEDLLATRNSLKCIFDEPAAESVVSEEFDGLPGSSLGADEQCRIFLKVDSAIAVDNGDKRCQVLLCKYRPSDGSIFKAGPGLQGSSGEKNKS